ncbi:hypothetical protein [Haloarchaeobius sp. TZWWS8]|uniref:hypothetical protein n=1 Tax=Haloarchaeobius sp. TZWWS8 TaxID=3446121 RepID=UPI003EBCBB72
MGTRESPLVETGFVLVTACLVGTVSGITVVLGPPVLTTLVVAVGDLAGLFYAGVFLGVCIGVTLSLFTAYLAVRLYRLQQTHRPQAQDGVIYESADQANARVTYREQVTGGDPPWVDMYLVGVVAALLTSLGFGLIATMAAGIGGAMLAGQLFAAV